MKKGGSNRAHITYTSEQKTVLGRLFPRGRWLWWNLLAKQRDLFQIRAAFICFSLPMVSFNSFIECSGPGHEVSTVILRFEFESKIRSVAVEAISLSLESEIRRSLQ